MEGDWEENGTRGRRVGERGKWGGEYDQGM